MRKDIRSYDVAIIGAGPVGCVTALSYAAKGAEVLLLEANPKAAGRLAGEWLHPVGLDILHDLGIDLACSRPYPTGKGFVVYPDDGSSPIVLPYSAGSHGFAFHHERLVDKLRSHVQREGRIDYQEPAKATRIVGQNLTFQSRTGASKTIFADQIVGAAGRNSVAHQALGIGSNVGTYSRMAGLLLETDVPFEGYGHVFLGALGPILMYRISADVVRVCIDVPLALRTSRDKEAVLYESYAYALPKVLREPFRKAILHGEVSFATNQTRPRVAFGRPGLALVGDAVGHHHPLTALGMTLGFQDARSLARSTSFAAYRRERSLESRVPEMLAIALYEVFADTHDEVIEIRRAIYDLWRSSPAERFRTMRFLACQDSNPLHFGSSFAKAMLRGASRLIGRGVASSQWSHVATITEEIGSRARWFMTGALHLTDARPVKELPRGSEGKAEGKPSVEDRFHGALRASAAKADVVELPSAREHAARTGRDRWDPAVALERGTKTLLALQDVDGSWEGEVVWCPMLAAQYVLTWHMMGLPIADDRRLRLLRHFDRTRLGDGTWGLSEVSDPNLFVTTLVYVASRLLGEPATSPALVAARRFLEREGGAVELPSWGKQWLAMLSLYGWDGVNPIIPEIWGLPSMLPVHPSRFQSHTRITGAAMAALYGERFQAGLTPVVEELRDELFPQGYTNVDFVGTRSRVRSEDLYEVPGPVLRTGYDLVRWVDKLQTERGRKKALEAIREEIRWELVASNHTSINAVSGLLSALALYAADPNDPDVAMAVRRFETWIWEDDRGGARVAGARSATWDTAHAVQALAACEAAAPSALSPALVRGSTFLASQQISSAPAGHREHHRIDPRGGYPVSFAAYGWPLSDATAEAMLARMTVTTDGGPSDDDVVRAAEFVLRARSGDGGFGSYEPRRRGPSLEWLNPSELFGDHMTERSYVECTASCVAFLARLRDERPHLLRRAPLHGLTEVLAGAVAWLRARQLPQGCWQGAWGVHYVYGTMFGLRGLLAAGVPPTDPAVKKATAWLRAHQKPDGSWGERHAPHTTYYVEAEEGQVVQTAWALHALLLASEPDWDCLDRAARFLARTQLGSGEWPRQEPHGVFFHTALLEYSLYKSYFPLLALAAFEARRRERDLLIQEARRATVAAE
jgi:lanosterol synthase